MATDPQVAMQMAQQEMEYRVELFNKCAQQGREGHGGPPRQSGLPHAPENRGVARTLPWLPGLHVQDGI